MEAISIRDLLPATRNSDRDRTNWTSRGYKGVVEPKSQLGDEFSDIARSEFDKCTDEELLIQVHQGQRDSVERLYRRHGSSLLALLTRILGDHQMAEEAVQDTFLAVWNGATFDGRSRVRTWLVAIAIRQAGSKRRRRRLAVGNPFRDFASNDPSPEDAVVAGLDVDRLVKILSEMTRYQREVVLLTFAEQLTHPEIAEVLGVRIGTVKSRLHGAKRALMRKWEQEDRT
jgi:RNA polymerase sigma factor (sigma-70 family)